MSTAGRLKYVYLAYFSKPAASRTLYRSVRRQRTSKMLLVGLTDLQLAKRLMQTAADVVPPDEIHFAAIDLFEARAAEAPGMALKDAYRELKASGLKVQLIPGDPQSALVRSANALGQRDLILISREFDETSLAAGWYYIPRMLHAGTRVYQEIVGDGGIADWRAVSVAEIDRLASAYRPRKTA